MDVRLRTSHTHGFSLLQLITTIACLSILLSMAIPSWQSFTQRQAIVTTRANFVATLNLARMSAITQTQTVTLCPSLDADNCSNDHTSWQQGYILFMDTNADKKRDSNESLLRAHYAFRHGIKIHSSSGRKAIRYAADGSAWGSNVTLRFCDPHNNANNLAIILHGTGRLRLSDTLGNGSMISC